MNSEVPDRVVVVGSGSIAARHVRNLRFLGVSAIIVVTTRDLSSETDFGSPPVTVLADLPDDCPRHAIVANDTDRHVATALELVRRGCHVLIEKPVAVRVDQSLDALTAEVRRRGVVARVAYNLRFLPVFREIERLLEVGAIGPVLFSRIEAGQNLEAWRPGRSYASGYGASPDRGGGAALDLSHELDYMRMLFGQPATWLTHEGHSGSLGIASADMFDAVYEFPKGLVCSVHLDYLESALRRRLRIVGADGVIDCDIAAHCLSMSGDGHERTVEDDSLFDVARTYVDELLRFFAETSGGESGGVGLASIADGRAVLDLVRRPPCDA